jgi:poly [ADP-ribose] polymerase
MNPIDYVLSSMNLKIQQLKKENSNYDLLMNYIKNSENPVNIKNIFQIEKIGEAEFFNSKWDNLKNKTLLFHGSKVFNFLGILTNGLKICPSEAPSTGLAFGKGIYFSDHFSKSYAYCDYYEYEDSKKNKIRNKYMLICEVALGNMFDYSEEKSNEIMDMSFPKSNFINFFFLSNFYLKFL